MVIFPNSGWINPVKMVLVIFFDVVGGADNGKFTGDFNFASHAEAPETAVF